MRSHKNETVLEDFHEDIFKVIIILLLKNM